MIQGERAEARSTARTRLLEQPTRKGDTSTGARFFKPLPAGLSPPAITDPFESVIAAGGGRIELTTRAPCGQHLWRVGQHL
jgi:hypothetical protein